MKKYLLSIYLLAIVFPQSYGQMGTRPSVTLHFGPAFLFGEPSHSFKESFAIVNMGVDCAAVVYKGFGFTIGVRGGNHLSPEIPKDYQPGKGFLGKASDKFYDGFFTTQALLTYSWHPANNRFLLIRPAVGAASTRFAKAHFKPSTRSAGWFGPSATHDILWEEAKSVGLAAQVSVLGVLPLGAKHRWQLEAGPTLWSVPGVGERRYGLDGRMGVTFFAD